MTITPPMAVVWHHMARKYLGDRVDIVLFDSTGTMRPEDVPGARLIPFVNFYPPKKGDEFLRHVATSRRIAWICDDDMFPLSGEAVDIVEKEMAVPGTASVSFRPRIWWEFDIGGKRIQPSGSYCFAVNRDIVIGQEHLSLRQANGNAHPGTKGRNPHRYDTFDKANETLLLKGYRCAVVPEDAAKRCFAEFSGVSGGSMLLHYFRTPAQTLDYFLSAPPERWSGNILFRLLSALLSLCTIQEMYMKIRGKRYPLPSLPPREALLDILEQRKSHLRPDMTLDQVEDAARRLWSHL